MVDYLSIADRSWPVLRLVMRCHAAMYRVTGGTVGKKLPGLPPMLLLDHFGARSGKKRTTPLVYMPDGTNFVVVGAKGGHPKSPDWVHNLRAVPDTRVQVGSDKIRVRAREANPEERSRLWRTAVEYNPLWAQYQARTQRTIPIVILRPLAPLSS